MGPQLGQSCWPQQVNGQWRCVPPGRIVPGPQVYADSSCQTRAIIDDDRFECPPKYLYEDDRTENGGFLRRYYTVDAPYTSDLYVYAAGTCLSGYAVKNAFALEPVPDETFAPVEAAP